MPGPCRQETQRRGNWKTNFSWVLNEEKHSKVIPEETLQENSDKE